MLCKGGDGFCIKSAEADGYCDKHHPGPHTPPLDTGVKRSGKDLARIFLLLLDEERNHHLRCPFPKKAELKAAERALREWIKSPLR